MAITRVWIEDGCISCNLCEDVCPEVFEVPAGGSCRTTPEHAERIGDPKRADAIREAVDGCPVEVIQIEQD